MVRRSRLLELRAPRGGVAQGAHQARRARAEVRRDPGARPKKWWRCATARSARASASSTPATCWCRWRWTRRPGTWCATCPRCSASSAARRTSRRAITDKEANQILRRVEEGVDKPRPKVLFEPGEVVRVVRRAVQRLQRRGRERELREEPPAGGGADPRALDPGGAGFLAGREGLRVLRRLRRMARELRVVSLDPCKGAQGAGT